MDGRPPTQEQAQQLLRTAGVSCALRPDSPTSPAGAIDYGRTVPPGLGFTETAATTALVATCRLVDLDDRDAILVRIGSNAVFRLRSPGDLAYRPRPREMSEAYQQIAVARWLERRAIRRRVHSN